MGALNLFIGINDKLRGKILPRSCQTTLVAPPDLVGIADWRNQTNLQVTWTVNGSSFECAESLESVKWSVLKIRSPDPTFYSSRVIQRLVQHSVSLAQFLQLTANVVSSNRKTNAYTTPSPLPQILEQKVMELHIKLSEGMIAKAVGREKFRAMALFHYKENKRYENLRKWATSIKYACELMLLHTRVQ